MTTPTTPAPAGDVQALIVECRDLAAERGEKAAEQFMIAGILRDQDRNPSGFLMAGEQAARTQKALTDAAAALERLSTSCGHCVKLDVVEGRLAAALKERDEARGQWRLYRDAAGLEAKHLDEAEDVLASERAARERAEQALRSLLDRYTELANCGDCGNWNPEEEAEVIAARAALQPQPQPQPQPQRGGDAG